MLIDRLDYTNKDTWSEKHLPEIAEDLGYVLNNGFIKAFYTFSAETVVEARVTSFLFVYAENFFREVKPPLEKINNGH